MSNATSQDLSFTDELYEWMERAPWVMLSITFHALILLALALIPWHLFAKEQAPTFEARIDQVEQLDFEEPLPKEPLETETTLDEVVEPVLGL